MEFTKTGTERHNIFDFWLVDNKKDWAIIPSGTIRGISIDMPIRLQTGKVSWGKTHIEKRHGNELKQIKMTVCELLHKKLGQPGSFYSSEEENKIKLVMRLAPDTLVILRHIETRYEEFFTVTTMYRIPRSIDGSEVGRYFSSFRESPTDNAAQHTLPK